MPPWYIVYLPAEAAGAPTRLDHVLGEALAYAETALGRRPDGVLSLSAFMELGDADRLRGSRLLFACALDEGGINLDLTRLIGYLRRRPHSLEEAVGCILLDGSSDLYTKDAARRLAFAANGAGCCFPGKPLVEGTGSLQNFTVQARLLRSTTLQAYIQSARELTEKLLTFARRLKPRPAVLAVHAGIRKTSNSLRLWEMTAAHLAGRADVEEISIRNGQLWDCRGCKYEECLHFGENSSCFYGGVMVEKVYPAIIDCDAVVLICPNYNDAVSANLSAFINRLTAVFRTHDFSRKSVYALVVSGYSGGDIVAQQVLGAMCMNKNFVLPGHFALLATANDPGSIEQVPGIEAEAAALAARILG